MKNFKEIAEKCLAGELSGTFILRNHTPLHSKYLYRYKIGRDTIYGYYWLRGIVLNEKGEDIPHKERIQNFIQDNMQKKIEIDIPEGMEAVQEIVDGEIRIKFVEKKLTYNDIFKKLVYTNEEIQGCSSNDNSKSFYKKVEILRKLTNIRNYFGKPDSYNKGYLVEYSRHDDILKVMPIHTLGDWVYEVIFKEKEHAEQAIKMLGDELKYLFEPW